MVLIELLLSLAPGFTLGLIFGATLFYLFGRRKPVEVDKVMSTLDVIKSRRTITPKNLNGKKLSTEQLDLMLEAANWAPTHKKTEPW
jgi:hypothetical protein